MCNEANIKLSPSKFLPHCSPCITIHCFLREDELHWVSRVGTVGSQPKPQPRGNYLYPDLSTGLCCVMQSVLSFLTRWKIILTSQDRVMFPKLHVDTRSWSPHFSLTAPQSYLLIRLKMIRPSQASTCTSAGKSALAALLRCGVRKMKEKPHWPGRSRVRAAVETPATIRGATISCQAAAE